MDPVIQGHMARRGKVSVPSHPGGSKIVDSDSKELFDIDDTPKIVAGFGLGALAVLVALKAFGFRFSFGVAAGR